jgi:Tellurite resistance protein TehB
MQDSFQASVHWTAVYAEHDRLSRSWTQESPRISLQLVESVALDKHARFIDVGGGASDLALALLRDGYSDVTVLDVAENALGELRTMVDAQNLDTTALGTIVRDVTDWIPDRTYDAWHDRAVFHFLIDEASRSAYRSVLLNATHDGSTVMIATFGPDGPATCSGLPVRRYSTDELVDFFSPDFRAVITTADVHLTPTGNEQSFSWVVLRR